MYSHSFLLDTRVTHSLLLSHPAPHSPHHFDLVDIREMEKDRHYDNSVRDEGEDEGAEYDDEDDGEWVEDEREPYNDFIDVEGLEEFVTKEGE